MSSPERLPSPASCVLRGLVKGPRLGNLGSVRFDPNETIALHPQNRESEEKEGGAKERLEMIPAQRDRAAAKTWTSLLAAYPKQRSAMNGQRRVRAEYVLSPGKAVLPRPPRFLWSASKAVPASDRHQLCWCEIWAARPLPS